MFNDMVRWMLLTFLFLIIRDRLIADMDGEKPGVPARIGKQ